MNLSTVALAAFTAECRDDWKLPWIEGALAQARAAGWSDEKILIETARLIADPAGQPRNLLSQDAIHGRHAGSPANEEFRAALAAIRPATADTEDQP